MNKYENKARREGGRDRTNDVNQMHQKMRRRKAATA
jgi:hypothetical protein